MISVQNLHKSFGKLKVLDGVTTNLEAGHVVALIGPNGSGKTTFISTIGILVN